MLKKLLEKIKRLILKEGVYYVGGSQDLPPPLEREEEERGGP